MPKVDNRSASISTVRVIVSVEFPGHGDPVDLDVPATVASQQLSVLIANAIYPESGSATLYTISIESHGLVLNPDQSLADVGVWDGATLVLQPIHRIAQLHSRHSGKKYPLTHPEVYIGRTPFTSSDRPDSVTLDFRDEPDIGTLSRQHACIFRQEANWILEHLPQASNPTWVNNVEVAKFAPVSLSHSDSVRFGDLEFLFLLE